MRLKYLFIFIVLAAIVLPLSAETKKIVVLQTADIHSYLRYKRNDSVGGWLRLATLLKNQRKADPETLLIDCGDVLQGSLEGSLSKGQASADMLNMLGYDVWVIGNHDFDFGPERLKELTRSSKASCLAANLTWDKEPTTQEWKMFERKNVKIAVIGATTPNLDEWLWGNNLKGYTLEPIETAVDKCMPEVMKAKPDIIILAMHWGSFSSGPLPETALWALAKKYPQIDIFLGAHTHIEDPGRKVMKSWFCQPGKHGSGVARIEISFDTEKRRVLSIKSKIIKTGSATPEDYESKMLLKDYLNAAYQARKKVIGNTSTPLEPLEDEQMTSSLNKLFGKAIADATGSKIAFHGTVWAKVLKDDITEADVFYALPYEDTVCTLELSGSEVREIIKEQFQKRKSTRFQSPWGLKINTDKDGNITGKIKFADGSTWQDESKRVKTAFSSYTLAGSGKKFPTLKKIALTEKAKPHDTGNTVRSTVQNYIKTKMNTLGRQQNLYE